MAMASGGYQTLTTVAATIFDSSADGARATVYTITNTDATNDALINVAGVSKPGEYFVVGPGKTVPFFGVGGCITVITGKSSASTVAITGGKNG